MRRAIASIAVVGSFALAPAAQAEIASVPANASGGGDIACTVQPGGPNEGERHCSGIFTSFDEVPFGAPIDVNIGFPPAPAGEPDGNFPIVGVFHGWGGSKESLTGNGLQQWLDDGYAVFSMSDRGWGMSCGGLDRKRPTPACQNGYNHLLDTRYEVRDAQEVFEALADRDADGALAGTTGLIDPQGIAATGGSYGGGMAMALGALRDRKMIGGEALTPDDGELIPWASDEGKAMEIAAVQPDIPWTDLAYSLQPNGATLDYVADAPYLGPDPADPKRIGVLKQSFVAGLYGVGAATSNYAEPGTDLDADLTRWYTQINAGEPYDENPEAAEIVDELTRHHSSYYIEEHADGPAPMLISNGWTDDLFPADEAIRFYNRTRTNHPDTPISLMFTDHGHMRGQNKDPDSAFRNRERHAWFDFYVKDEGTQPFDGVQTLTQTCGDGVASGGATGPFDDPTTDLPFQAPSWAELAPGEVRFQSADAQTITPQTSAPQNAQAFDPVAGGGACATTDATDQTGAANYRLDPAPAGGYTLMGSPTVIADFFTPGPTSQVAVRLLDVDPATNEQTLVARGLWRPEVNPADGAATRQVFQLHANGWRFAEGHIAKLELLPSDQPYGRNSNGQLPVTVDDLDLRLPVLEDPGTAGDQIEEPAGKVIPPGYELAAGYQPATDTDDDGFPDDGDADDDGDGVADGSDACPLEAGAGANGCPPISMLPADDDSGTETGSGTDAGTAANIGTGTDAVATGGPCSGAKLQSGTLEDDVLAGSGEADAMFGLAGRDELSGLGGDDCISGQRGRDSISGGDGADRLIGNGQRDRIDGGSGSDRIAGRLGRDRIDARDGERDRVSCGAGRDRVVADPQDRLRGCEIVRLGKR